MRRAGGLGRGGALREIDCVLGVPTIPAPLRKTLLQRVHSTDVASSLASIETAPSRAPAKAADVKGS